MGTFIVAFIGNGFVGSAQKSTALSFLNSRPIVRRRLLVLLYFSSIVSVVFLFGVMTIPDIIREGADFVRRLKSENVWVVVLEKMRNGLGYAPTSNPCCAVCWCSPAHHLHTSASDLMQQGQHAKLLPHEMLSHQQSAMRDAPAEPWPMLSCFSLADGDLFKYSVYIESLYRLSDKCVPEEASHCSVTHTLVLRCPELVYTTHQCSAICLLSAALEQACLSQRMSSLQCMLHGTSAICTSMYLG